MNTLKTFTIRKSIQEDNIKVANATRDFLKNQNTFLINVMSSPGSGKTSTLVRTIERLKNDVRLGVIEADVDSDVDARAVQNAGAKAVQMHTGGLCHLDATMTRTGLEELEVHDLDLVFLENIGNLICTVGHDTGAMRNIAILSVPEGDDKPLKYPMMFEKVDALIINKTDVMPYFDFNMEVLEERVRKLNPNVKIFPISAKNNTGLDAWIEWVQAEMKGQ
ncbi:hydrogenase nickel incorporation protein HypB [Fusibacter tunisiensis]|uniref:Hydrogenase nickel incorporation protein HypB n=1 Tax=Fusibacter tunisiensis TaxID=1008308 RepID=A0ABS2MU41_9FIRM|nr:hydrogenase nickel incorporation protein HypB [Fusibacter tunisiensis]MBM7562787.1 hydrogenase nickel incorporation protein HypB [Fusibacter tunisiensis]